ncbi:MAG TPA: Crp/Fnr family transcriptional regulator, partial [Terriglobia bacterium]|nr:Crp/Fnr family transcriptional regulator [Terriglobia bacterium]
MRFTDHQHCAVLSKFCRGKLCEQLTQRPGRVLGRGEFIFLPSSPADSVYFLRDGLVKTSTISESGEELILAIHQPGEIFGELCLCGGERHAQALAMEPSEVVEIPFEALMAHLQGNRQALTDFLSNLVRHLAEAYSQLETLAFDPTVQRLARTLLKLAQELGKPTPDGLEIDHYIRQEELAQMIGARREVVSTALNRLREMGLIDYSR